MLNWTDWQGPPCRAFWFEYHDRQHKSTSILQLGSILMSVSLDRFFYTIEQNLATASQAEMY